MAKQQGKSNGPNHKRPALKYFFYDDKAHRKLSVNRGKDLLVAWNYPDGKRVSLSYTNVVRRHSRAFTTTEVCKMINRSRRTIDNVMKDGMIEKPQFTYGLDENRNFFQYLWREKDIMGLLDYLSGIHRGRPRKDGEITPQNLPTPRELRAMIHDESILYVKQGDMFIPSWRAKDI